MSLLFENIWLFIYNLYELKYRDWVAYEQMWFSFLSLSKNWQCICWAGDWRSRKINCFLVSNILKALFLCSLGMPFKPWLSYNSRDNIPYWEKLHNSFWFEWEHRWRALNLLLKDVWRASTNGYFSRQNWRLNPKIYFIFIFNGGK